MALHWFRSAFNPTFEEFQVWLRESPEGDATDLYNDSKGGCQDFDLMVNLTADEFEELLYDTTEGIAPEARRFIADLLACRVRQGDLKVSLEELERWASGSYLHRGDEVAREGVELLREKGGELLSEATVAREGGSEGRGRKGKARSRKGRR